jgi:hypothetical protein
MPRMMPGAHNTGHANDDSSALCLKPVFDLGPRCMRAAGSINTVLVERLAVRVPVRAARVLANHVRQIMSANGGGADVGPAVKVAEHDRVVVCRLLDVECDRFGKSNRVPRVQQLPTRVFQPLAHDGYVRQHAWRVLAMQQRPAAGRDADPVRCVQEARDVHEHARMQRFQQFRRNDRGSRTKQDPSGRWSTLGCPRIDCVCCKSCLEVGRRKIDKRKMSMTMKQFTSP